jgi:DNA-binding transcriptional LysR family regulator
MNNLNRYPPAALRALEAAGRLGGLAKAAEELGVTVGAVSQHVRKVEAQLGRRIFEREGRGVRPTAVGAPLLAGLSRGFAEISRALAGAEARPQSILTISVAPALATKWLVPRLTRFYTAHPNLRLRIDAAVQLVDLDASDIDAGLRVGKGPWPKVRAEWLAPLVLFPVCSPALAAGLARPEDLSALPIIDDHGAPGRWPLWLAAKGVPDLPLRRGPVYSDAVLCLEAAIAGQGVAMAWPTLAVDALRAGILKSPFPEAAAGGESYWLVTSAARSPSIPLRAFGSWLREELAADCVV